MISYTVSDVPEYLKIVELCTKEWFKNESTWGPWFRGQSDADWALRPGIYRHFPVKRSLRALEDEIRQEFAVRAPSLGPERPQNSWEWYFLMQHSGAPTRLLDWTESALMALYFAVKGKGIGSNTDSAVWVLEPWKLNECVAKSGEVIAPGAEAGMVTRHASRYKPWLPDRYANPHSLKKQFPIAVYPTHFARRISAQRSCFTVHGYDPDGFSNLPYSFLRYLRKVVIPAAKAHAIETSLSVAGVDEVTVFPDLDGLGRWLAAVLRDEGDAPTTRRHALRRRKPKSRWR